MRVSRTDWTDVLVEDDEAAVFVGGQVVVLSELATALALEVDDGADLDDLVVFLEGVFGPPPTGDLRDAVTAVVDDLVAAGVLTTDSDVVRPS